MSGIASEVRGILSAIMSKNTVKASNTDIPNEIFSPASGGKKKPIIISTDNMRHGNTILTI